jgi:hypothetical protein
VPEKDHNPGITRGWDSNKWLDKPLADFCNDDDEDARNVVCDVINKMLQPSGQRLTGTAKHDLRNSVDSQTVCKSAIELMVKAKNSVEPT